MAPTRVLFCGAEAPAKAAIEVLERRGHGADEVEIVWCRTAEVPLEAPKADVLVALWSTLSRGLLETCPRAKVCMQHGVGVDGIDAGACDDFGIWLSNVPSNGTYNAIGVAELAVYLLVGALREHNGMLAAVAARRTGTPIGSCVASKRVLLVGFGGLGVEVAKRLAPWGCELSALRAREWVAGRDGEEADAVARHLTAKGTWDRDRLEFAKHADAVIVCALGSASNASMIGREFLDACPDGVVVVNVARGSVLDREAVSEALESGKIGYLSTDVFWEEPFDPADPIATHPRVYVTPHVGGGTRESLLSKSEGIVDAALAVHAGKAPPVCLNAPANPRVGDI